MSDQQRTCLGIKSLPSSLDESLAALKNDNEYLKSFFRGDLLETYIELKHQEISYTVKSKEKEFMLYHDI
jgi:glutamine synthetase